MIICEEHSGLLRGTDCPYCRIAELERQLKRKTIAKTCMSRMYENTRDENERLREGRFFYAVVEARNAELEAEVERLREVIALTHRRLTREHYFSALYGMAKELQEGE
jgi:hypothetical protein